MGKWTGKPRSFHPLLDPWPVGITAGLARSSKGKSENFCSVLCCCALCQRFLHLCIRIARLYGREGIVELCAYVNGHIYKDLSRGTHFAIAIIISLLFWEKNQPHFARNKHKVLFFVFLFVWTAVWRHLQRFITWDTLCHCHHHQPTFLGKKPTSLCQEQT